MHSPKTIEGKHVSVYQLNDFFSNVTEMILAHFDKPHRSEVFVLGNYVFESSERIRSMFPGRRLIAYQLEQMMGGHNWHGVSETIGNLRGYDEVWDYDLLNVHFLRQNDIKVDRVVPMLYTDSLRRVTNSEFPDNDVFFFGFMNERRWKLMENLQRQCYNELEIVWLFGKNMDKQISNSKVVLNIHAFEPWNRQEQTRIFYPIINEKTVVSESSQHNQFEGLLIESDAKQLADVLMSVCRTDIWRSFGRMASGEFKRRTDQFLSSNP